MVCLKYPTFSEFFFQSYHFEVIQNLTESAAAYSVRGEFLSYGLLGGPAKTPARMEPDVHLHDTLLQMLQCLGRAQWITVSFFCFFVSDSWKIWWRFF